MMIVSEMRIDVRRLGGITVVRPTGRLDVGSYPAFRDGLLKLAADEPDAVVVRLGAEFVVKRPSMLAVFTTVWMRVSEWPGVPIVVVPETARHQTDVRQCGVSRFVPAFSSLRAALKSVGRPPQHRRDVVELPCELSAPRTARAFVRAACARWGVSLVAEDAILVASELTENAVRHAASSSVLRVELRPGALAVASRDSDPRPPELVASGHGIDLVDKVSRTWGWSPSFDGGKVVWAVLAVG